MTKLYSLHQVQFTYAKKPVLDIDHLEIESNSITAILGNNGAGKSTLLKVLALLETPQHGYLKFKGKDFMVGFVECKVNQSSLVGLF